MRLLIVEDEPEISAFIVQAVQEAGFAADSAKDGRSALALAEEGVYDAFVIDLGLPDMDGLQVIEELHGRGVQAPVLILSARRSVEDRVRGLEQGGDDYLPKPFAVAELIARLRALLRRATGRPRRPRSGSPTWRSTWSATRPGARASPSPCRTGSSSFSPTSPRTPAGSSPGR